MVRSVMKRVLTVSVLAFALAACAGKKTTETGPKLSARVSCNFDNFSAPDTELSSKDCGISSTNDYEITIELDVDDGTQKDDPPSSTTAEPTFPAQALDVTATVNGAPVTPAPTFTQEPSFQSSRSTSDKIVVPGTSKGQSVVIHAQTHDSRGLKSNPIDLTFMLN